MRQFEREMENDATIGWLECSVTPLVVQLASNELKRVVRGPTAQTQSSARAAPVWRKRTLCGRARGILPMPGLSEVGAKAAAAAALQSSRLQILIPFSGARILLWSEVGTNPKSNPIFFIKSNPHLLQINSKSKSYPRSQIQSNPNPQIKSTQVHFATLL